MSATAAGHRPEALDVRTVSLANIRRATGTAGLIALLAMTGSNVEAESPTTVEERPAETSATRASLDKWFRAYAEIWDLSLIHI